MLLSFSCTHLEGVPAGSRKSATSDTLPYLPRIGKRPDLLVLPHCQI